MKAAGPAPCNASGMETTRILKSTTPQATPSHWQTNTQGELEKEFVFQTFPEAFSFMTRVAFEAERMNHHPDWANSYNRVRIRLMSHDAGKVTEKDQELARRIDAIDWS